MPFKIYINIIIYKVSSRKYCFRELSIDVNCVDRFSFEVLQTTSDWPLVSHSDSMQVYPSDRSVHFFFFSCLVCNGSVSLLSILSTAFCGLLPPMGLHISFPL